MLIEWYILSLNQEFSEDGNASFSKKDVLVHRCAQERT